MDWELFQETVRRKVQERMGEGILVENTWVEKNNQVVCAGIGIRREGHPMKAVANLEAYYGQYQSGNMEIEEVVKDLCRILEIHRESFTGGEERPDYQKVKDKILFCLVNREKNQKLLEEIPHLPFLDMAIIFRLLLGENEGGQLDAFIHWETCRNCPGDARDWFIQARENMLQRYPPRLKSIEDIMREIAKSRLAKEGGGELPPDLFDGGEGSVPMYVLSNRQGIRGAGALLYPDVLRAFADSWGSDVIILPSSIHEVILVPYEEGLDVCWMREMVRNINRAEVPPEDWLSDQVYRYQREKDAITIAE